MTDNELLLAIADIMDRKLDTRLIPIEKNIHEMQSDIQSIKGDIVSMKDDIDDMKSDIVFMKDDIDFMKADIVSMKDDINFMKADIVSMKGDITSLQSDVHNIKLIQENIVLPRLNTIESCYTTTYSRYKDYADKMADAFVDIDLLKKVVSEHSERLQKIS